MQGKAGELRIFLQVLIVSRAHLSDGDPELGEMIQIQPVGVFEDSFLEHWLNFLPVRHHLHDGEDDKDENDDGDENYGSKTWK